MSERIYTMYYRMIGVLAIGSVLGCQSPSPAYDPFAGYGATRVPPPATGSIGRGGYGQAPLAPVPPNSYPVGGTMAPSASPPTLRPVPSLAPPPNQGTSHNLPAATGNKNGQGNGLVWLPPNSYEGQSGYQPQQPTYAPPLYGQFAAEQPTYSYPSRVPGGYPEGTIQRANATAIIDPLAPMNSPQYVVPAQAIQTVPYPGPTNPSPGPSRPVAPASPTWRQNSVTPSSVPITQIGGQPKTVSGEPWRSDDCNCGEPIDMIPGMAGLEPIPYGMGGPIYGAVPSFHPGNGPVTRTGWRARDEQRY